MKKLLSFFLFIILFTGGLWWRGGYCVSSKNYVCAVDPIFSEECANAIEKTLENVVLKDIKPHEIIETLQKKFPVIKKMSIAYKPQGNDVIVQGYAPVSLINSSFVLTGDNQLFQKTDYDSSVLEKLPAVSVLQDSMFDITHLVSTVLGYLPSHFYDTYDLVIVNDHNLKLIDKLQPQFAIVCSADQQLSPAAFSQCENLKKNMMTSGAFDRGMEWVADIRFAHYIIAYKT